MKATGSRKLKLGDKIRKFFGQEGGKGLHELGSPLPATSGRSIDAGRGLSMIQGPHGHDWAGAGAGGAGAGALGAGGDGKVSGYCGGGAATVNLVSAKADLASNPRTTGTDAAYSLHNEICFPQLLDTLAGGSPEQRAVAAEALFNFTAESDSARQRATAAGVVAHLTELLSSGTDHARMYAAYTLSSLTSIDEALAQMREMRAPAALVALLAGCPLLVCKKGAMRALGRLARNDEAAAEIVAAGGLRPIVALLGHADASLVRRCLVALYFVGADKPDLQAQLGAVPGAIAQLVSLLRSENPDVRAEAADVVKVVSRSPLCGAQIAEAGGLELLAAMAAGTAPTGGGGGGGSASGRARASAARALQRLNELPELRAAMASQFGAAPAGGEDGPGAPAAPRAVPRSGSSGALSAAGGAHVGGAGMNAALLEEVAEAAEGDDVRELVAAVTRGSSWMRAKAAAAIEQVAADDPTASK